MTVSGVIVAGVALSFAAGDPVGGTPLSGQPILASPDRPSMPAPSAPPAPSVPPTPSAAPASSRTDHPVDGAWTLLDYTPTPDPLGAFGGTVTVLNGAESTRDGLFTLTVGLNGATVATLRGYVTSVPAGQVATGQVISTDRYVPGALSIEFRSELP
ncbi:hypothetical protein [Embleya scabrispora]|uniref:hypothetical protein n=1 Tax=Embleya scabrispora TaxID=159449 RepID=UPI0003A6652D|nr:hypothetical protein [Embleya scabrispora]MYS86057.1 hypothetical protein [Streptomyces sp. SID5474]